MSRQSGVTLETRELEAVARAFEKAPQAASNAARQSLSLIGIRWEKDVKGRFRPYARGAGLLDINTGPNLRSITGKLQSSVRSKVKGYSLNTVRLQMQAGSPGETPGARIQEYGGTIRAKGKLLTVPTIFAKDASGQIRPDARLSGSGRGTAGGLDTYVTKSKAGNLFIFARRFGAGAIMGPETPLYMLKQSVKIPPRLGMRKSLRSILKKEKPLMMKNIARSIFSTRRLKKMARSGR